MPGFYDGVGLWLFGVGNGRTGVNTGPFTGFPPPLQIAEKTPWEPSLVTYQGPSLHLPQLRTGWPGSRIQQPIGTCAVLSLSCCCCCCVDSGSPKGLHQHAAPLSFRTCNHPPPLGLPTHLPLTSAFTPSSLFLHFFTVISLFFSSLFIPFLLFSDFSLLLLPSFTFPPASGDHLTSAGSLVTNDFTTLTPLIKRQSQQKSHLTIHHVCR